ncbi:MAG: hypothetical protein EAX96_07535 [Candidatus Lokiarchaeota archaeon]|nr:hypothetical protein [Candidatus Lokiarchaeota archaeon]
MKQKITACEIFKKSDEILKKWDCIQCGFCCNTFKLGVSGDDWERWEGKIVDSNIGSYPLRDFCNTSSKEYSKIGDLFFHPETGEKLDSCPFLEERNGKFFCQIHDPKLKPTICKEWHAKLIDIRCVRTRQIINEMYGLEFNTKMDEWIYFEGLLRDYIKIQEKKGKILFFRTLLELSKIDTNKLNQY